MAKPTNPPRRRRAGLFLAGTDRPAALSPTQWRDAHRAAEAAGQIRLLETEPVRPTSSRRRA